MSKSYHPSAAEVLDRPDRVRRALRRWGSSGAVTSDVARSCGLDVKVVGPVLEKLHLAGIVERQALGRGYTWRLAKKQEAAA